MGGFVGQFDESVAVTASPDAKPGEYRFGQLVVRVVDRVLPPAQEWIPVGTDLAKAL